MSRVLEVSRYRREDLGLPIPDDPHGVSVCLPLWEHNVGYEEADPAVTSKMQCGYPRFFLHPSVVKLMDFCNEKFAKPGECCFVFPTARIAGRCAEFVSREESVPTRTEVAFADRVHVVVLPTGSKDTAKAFWQHSGEIISSRYADHILGERLSGLTEDDPKSVLRQRVANMVDAAADDVFLFPSGMAAVYAGYRAFQRLSPTARSLQFGFPYVDILKVQQRFARVEVGPEPCAFFPRGDAEEIDHIQRIAAQQSVMGLFCEFPSNPLLKSPDLNRLRQIADEFRFPVLVDDTLGACINTNVNSVADVIGTSLTKYFSGTGNVAAGALILNRDKSHYARLRQSLETEYEDILFHEDAVVLERNSRDYAERVAVINHNSQRVSEYLQGHPAIEEVWYPAHMTRDHYEAFQRPGAGFGGLMSIVLKDAARTTPGFFDALEIPKGPNLGTNFTLCCPYTILAHYNELDFAESCGISSHLIRISIGTESVDWILDRFRAALDRV